MATADDYAAWIVKNADKKGTPEFDTVAHAYQLAKTSESQPQQTAFDPSEGGGTLSIGPFDTGIHTPQFLDRALAGAGKAISDTGQGLRQLGSYVGVGDKDAIQSQIDQARLTDAPLMNTGAGIAGNVLGNVATMVGPSALLGAAGKAAQIPRLVQAGEALMLPKTLPGAAGVGAAMGAAQPTETGENRLLNAGIGAAGGALIPGAATAAKIGGNLIAPFTQGGRANLAGRALQRFAGNMANIYNPAPELVPGSLPTLAESAQDPGISQLYRALVNNPDVGPALASRQAANTAARTEALRDIAGDAGKMDYFKTDRATVANDLYQKAFDQVPEATPWVKGQITQLQKRPSFQQAFPQAQALALEEGLKLDPNNAVQVAHYTKMALDDMISASEGNQQRALMGTRDKLVSLMESKDFAPAYREARDTYAKMSQPINQMQIGQDLLNRFQPALAEFGATNRTRAQAYAQAVRDANGTAKKATGFAGAKMADILTPEQMSTVQNVAQDLGRAANAQELGKAVGSPTAQNLVSQDILRQTLGPLGLPRSFAESTLGETLLRPVQFAYKAPENRVLGLLGQAMLDPTTAQSLLTRGIASQLPKKLDRLLPYSVAPGTAGLLQALAQ
jgi:hypothetical protein